MKTSELTGAALDWAVAECEFSGCEDWDHTLAGIDAVSDLEGKEYVPSTNWEQAGPIIEHEGMLIEFHGDHWGATMWWDDSENADEVTQKGPTPLVAAMRCYVASQFGDEVELPEELK